MNVPVPELRDDFEAVLAEVAIERESGPNPQPPHRFETGQVDQAQSPAAGGDERAHCLRMDDLVDPFDAHQRKNRITEYPNGSHAEPRLEQRHRLEHDVIRRNESSFVGRFPLP